MERAPACADARKDIAACPSAQEFPNRSLPPATLRHSALRSCAAGARRTCSRLAITAARRSSAICRLCSIVTVAMCCSSLIAAGDCTRLRFELRRNRRRSPCSNNCFAGIKPDYSSTLFSNPPPSPPFLFMVDACKCFTEHLHKLFRRGNLHKLFLRGSLHKLFLRGSLACSSLCILLSAIYPPASRDTTTRTHGIIQRGRLARTQTRRVFALARPDRTRPRAAQTRAEALAADLPAAALAARAT
jgi:hypothetical protein